VPPLLPELLPELLLELLAPLLLLELLVLELPLLELLLTSVVPLTVPPPQATRTTLAQRAIARACAEPRNWCRRAVENMQTPSEISARTAAHGAEGAVVRRDFIVYAQLLGVKRYGGVDRILSAT
jgi:hypothetical protein